MYRVSSNSTRYPAPCSSACRRSSEYSRYLWSFSFGLLSVGSRMYCCVNTNSQKSLSSADHADLADLADPADHADLADPADLADLADSADHADHATSIYLSLNGLSNQTTPFGLGKSNRS